MKSLVSLALLLSACSSSTMTQVPAVVSCQVDGDCESNAHCFDQVCIVGDQSTSSGALMGTYFGLDRESGDCTASYGVAAYRPQGPGPFPIYVYLHGTLDVGQPDTAWEHPTVHELFLKPMAARGFYALMPAYPRTNHVVNGTVLDHEIEPYYDDKARCLFSESTDPQSPHYFSLISSLNRLTEADSSLGVAIQGQSQGGIIALIAHGFNNHVAAALGTGVGNHSDRGMCQGVTGDFSALDEPRRSLPSARVRIVNGESDEQFAEGTVDCMATGGRGPQPREQFNEILGAQAQGCTPAASLFECLAENGSGWVIAKDSYVIDGEADHSYWVDSNGPDTNWRDDAGPGAGGQWTRVANQSWLQTMVFAQ